MGQGRVAGEALGARRTEGVASCACKLSSWMACARKGPIGVWVQALPDLACAALQGAPACRTTCQPSRALDQSRSCTAPSAPDGRMSPSRTSADSSTSSHFITAPQVKPAGCAGAAGEQEARDERASVRARGALRAGEQRTASDGSPRLLATRMPRRSRDLLALALRARCRGAQVLT